VLHSTPTLLKIKCRGTEEQLPVFTIETLVGKFVRFSESWKSETVSLNRVHVPSSRRRGSCKPSKDSTRISILFYV
jgi:hypothetical protein